MQHHHDSLVQRPDRRSQGQHHGAGILHIQIVQRLIQQGVIGLLGQNLRHKGTLPLTAGELIEKAVGQVEPGQEAAQ